MGAAHGEEPASDVHRAAVRGDEEASERDAGEGQAAMGMAFMPLNCALQNS